MRRSILILLSSLLATAFVVFWAGAAWLRMQSETTDLTADPNILQIIVGNDVLNVPANYIRIASQREGDTAQRLDLLMLWPDGGGYSEERAAQFIDQAWKNNRLLVTLSKRDMQIDMTGRLDTVYRELFEGPAHQTGTDLMLQRLKDDSGYAGEVLAVSTDKSWVARCETAPEDAFATCLRDVHLGQSLTLRYRFPRELLNNWREIEALVTGKVKGFLQT